MNDQLWAGLVTFYQAHKELFLVAGGAATTPTFRFLLTTITKIVRREGDLVARENTVELKEFIQSKFDTLNEKFDTLNEKVDTGFSEVNERLDRVDEKIESLDKRVFHIETLLSKLPFLNFHPLK